MNYAVFSTSRDIVSRYMNNYDILYLEVTGNILTQEWIKTHVRQISEHPEKTKKYSTTLLIIKTYKAYDQLLKLGMKLAVKKYN